MGDTNEINKHLYSLSTSGIPSNQDKIILYEDAIQTLQNVLEEADDTITRMATICSLLNTIFSFYFWTGFYRVDPQSTEELIVGPYNGTLGCTRIKFGNGVCGKAATEKQTVIVPNVHEFVGHISCDSKSQSEIVVPVLNSKQELIGVFDVDSELLNAFTKTDQQYLERIMQLFFSDNLA